MIPGGAIRKFAVVRWQDGSFSKQPQPDQLASEEPLEIRLCWGPPEQAQTQTLITTLRTPGADYELALGWLFAENLISKASDAVKITYCLGKNRAAQQYNVLQVRLKPGLIPDLSKTKRHNLSHGGCGLCGKQEIESLKQFLKPNFSTQGPVLEPEILVGLQAQVRPQQALFERSGGVHAAALFNAQGQLIDLKEDIGRHNAVDKLIGAALMAERNSLNQEILFLSGRAGFELVQKALKASLPVIVSVGAPSSLALELAQSYGQTLIGFLRSESFNIYTGAQRFQIFS
jgi:FdhD protein